jgi:hypothetical protein
MMSGLAAVLIGTDALDPPAAWERMERATLGYGRDGTHHRHGLAVVNGGHLASLEEADWSSRLSRSRRFCLPGRG